MLQVVWPMMTWKDAVVKESVDDRRKLADFCNGIEVFHQGRALILKLPKNLHVLSTGTFNGGFTDSPETVVDMGTSGGKLEWEMMGSREVVYEYTCECFRRLGLDPDKTVSEGTAANMNNASLGSAVSDGIPVSIAITAGIRGNGGCSGDPATFDEAEYYKETNGTIVMLLSVEADLSDTAMLQLMNIMVQAKSCVIQEMQARSLYSPRIATGSGTDQIAIIIDRKSERKLDSVKMDSAFAAGVVKLLKENLFRAFDWQSYMTPSTQAEVLSQISRFGITRGSMEDEIRFPNRMKDLLDAEEIVFHDPFIVSVVTAAARLQDASDAGTVDPASALDTARRMATGALSDILPHSDLFDLRIEDTQTIPEFLSLLVAMLVQYRATKIAEARQ